MYKKKMNVDYGLDQHSFLILKMYIKDGSTSGVRVSQFHSLYSNFSLHSKSTLNTLPIPQECQSLQSTIRINIHNDYLYLRSESLTVLQFTSPILITNY